MSQIVLYIAVSLDGYIARPDGSLDWLPAPEPEGDGLPDGYTQFYDSVDALVMGAATYEQVLTFGEWPYPGKPSYILSRRSLSTNRADIHIRTSLDDVLMEIQQQGYHRVWLVGGGKIISLFMQRGLVDEFIITVIPVILGVGIPLFASVPETVLELIQAKALSSGMTELHYRRKSSRPPS
jgi:dihydrofolate reductase